MTSLTAVFEKRFPGGAAIEADLTCRMDHFSISVLYGPSGCGKTTILRCLAGLERPERGTLRVGGDIWMDAAAGLCRSPQQRDIGFLFQEYALFPHLTVDQNVAFGLTHLPRADRRKQVSEISERFNLCGLGSRFPHQISGGQKQRVALARVLVRKPKLLLLDEPLSALDLQIRDTVRRELRKVLAGFAIPVILVTHDRIEALTLADQLIVLDQGQILQTDVPDAIYRRPNSIAVARMMGIETVEFATTVGRTADQLTIRVGTAHVRAVNAIAGGVPIAVGIHAVDVQLGIPVAGKSPRITSTNELPGRIQSVILEGPMVRVALDCGFPLVSLVTRPTWDELRASIGDSVLATIADAAIHVICNSGA